VHYYKCTPLKKQSYFPQLWLALYPMIIFDYQWLISNDHNQCKERFSTHSSRYGFGLWSGYGSEGPAITCPYTCPYPCPYLCPCPWLRIL